MQLEKYKIESHNSKLLAQHQKNFDHVLRGISDLGDIMQKLDAFQIAIPSWALGTGGTRFGRFMVAVSRETWKRR